VAQTVARERAQLEVRMEELDGNDELVDVTCIWRDGSVENVVGGGSPAHVRNRPAEDDNPF
jgi:hypothetical protein